MVAALAHDLPPSVETSIITLAAVAHALVSDVANVIRINAFRSAPLIIDASTNTNPALERTLSPWPGFVEWSPVELPPETARLRGLFSDGINPSG